MEEKKVEPLSVAELNRLLKVLFPWGYAKVDETRYIGPVPSRYNYNIMALETSEGYSVPDAVFCLIIIKELDDNIDPKYLCGFYVGVMAHAFPEYICHDDKFEESGSDILDFKRRDPECYGSWFFGWKQGGLTYERNKKDRGKR